MIFQNATLSMSRLALMAFWCELTKESTPVPEPSNIDNSLWPPTEMDGSPPNPKFAFVKTYERQEFTGTSTTIVPPSQKSRMKKKRAHKLSPAAQKEG